MAAKFVAASAQSLLRTGTPATTFPLTMACWAIPTFAGNGGGNQCAMSLGASGASYADFSLGCDGVPEWWLRRDVTAGGGLDELDVATGIVANTRQFALARVSSAANAWLHILNADGSISSAQSTTSVNPTGINQMAIGNFADGNEATGSTFDGVLGECWIADIDVWPGGGAINAEFLRYLAFNGPWSVPRIAASILEYKPFLQSLGQGGEAGGENYVRNGAGVWVNNNGVTLAPHMPLIASGRPDLARFGMV
jgi:hypothetical protein